MHEQQVKNGEQPAHSFCGTGALTGWACMVAVVCPQSKSAQQGFMESITTKTDNSRQSNFTGVKVVNSGK